VNRRANRGAAEATRWAWRCMCAAVIVATLSLPLLTSAQTIVTVCTNKTTSGDGDGDGETWQIVVTLVLLVTMLVAMAMEVGPADMLMMLMLITLLACRIINTTEAMQGEGERAHSASSQQRPVCPLSKTSPLACQRELCQHGTAVHTHTHTHTHKTACSLTHSRAHPNTTIRTQGSATLEC
jgi:hypothetical protein